MCGKNLSTDTSSTIGQQRQFNYALQPMTKAQFVTMMTTDLPEAPAYFAKDAESIAREHLLSTNCRGCLRWRRRRLKLKEQVAWS